jgi:hypothetical protein
MRTVNQLAGHHVGRHERPRKRPSTFPADGHTGNSATLALVAVDEHCPGKNNQKNDGRRDQSLQYVIGHNELLVAAMS